MPDSFSRVSHTKIIFNGDSEIFATVHHFQSMAVYLVAGIDSWEDVCPPTQSIGCRGVLSPEHFLLHRSGSALSKVPVI